jgi:hypothetical protein
LSQLTPQEAATLQATLQTAVTGAAGDDQSGRPTRPSQAYLRGNSSPEPIFERMSQFTNARSADRDSTERVALNSVSTSMTDSDEEAEDHIFLLVCITVNGMSSLEQLYVKGIENDKYLFDKIREAYHRTHAQSAWHQKIALTRMVLSSSGWLSRIFRFPSCASTSYLLAWTLGPGTSALQIFHQR